LAVAVVVVVAAVVEVAIIGGFTSLVGEPKNPSVLLLLALSCVGKDRPGGGGIDLRSCGKVLSMAAALSGKRKESLGMVVVQVVIEEEGTMPSLEGCGEKNTWPEKREPVVVKGEAEE